MSLKDKVLQLQQLLSEHTKAERTKVETLNTWLQELKEGEAFAPFDDVLPNWEDTIDANISDFLGEEPQS